jgi:hypothetical protein
VKTSRSSFRMLLLNGPDCNFDECNRSIPFLIGFGPPSEHRSHDRRPVAPLICRHADIFRSEVQFQAAKTLSCCFPEVMIQSEGGDRTVRGPRFWPNRWPSFLARGPASFMPP